MARQIQVIAWCDRCDANGRRIRALDEPHEVWVGGKLVTLDLCQGCREIIYDPLIELALEHGIAVERPEPPTRRPAKPPVGQGRSPEALEIRASQGTRHGMPPSGERHLPCPLCTLDYASDSGLRRHLTIGHGLPDDKTGYNVVYGSKCPVCGEGYNMLGGHAMRTHNAYTPQLLKMAEDMGDPLGIAAEIHANLQKMIKDSAEAKAALASREAMLRKDRKRQAERRARDEAEKTEKVDR